MTPFEIHCRCGAVALRISADPLAQLFCHCDDCRAAHNGAYVASSVHPAAAVEALRGKLAPVVVSRTERMRCQDCGTHMFSELKQVGARSVNAFLYPAGAFKPQFHVQCQHAVLPVVDDLPHFKAFPAVFGGADERVDW